jgi:Predicted oxidoreductase related to nitroreductase
MRTYLFSPYIVEHIITEKNRLCPILSPSGGFLRQAVLIFSFPGRIIKVKRRNNMKPFWEAIKARRSYYGFETGVKPVPEEKIVEIVKDAAKYVPSAFNSQSTRIVILFGEAHKKFWGLTLAALRKVVKDDEAFKKTEEKINTQFATGYGTILYFEDMSVIEGLQKSFPPYKDNFPVWSEHTNAMHQFVIWTALEELGLGASLQHYNPLVDESVKKEFELPEKWRLRAQMPFGKPISRPGEKEFQPVDEKVKVIK